MQSKIQSPYKVYKQRKQREKELQSRDSFNHTALRQEQLEMMVERDFDEIAEKYLDSGEYSDITIKTVPEYMSVLESVISRQGFDFVKLSDDKVVVRA